MPTAVKESKRRSVRSDIRSGRAVGKGFHVNIVLVYKNKQVFETFDRDSGVSASGVSEGGICSAKRTDVKFFI